MKADETLSTQPGLVLFPKGVLNKDDDGTKVPDGASLAYIKLAAELFLMREGDEEPMADGLESHFVRVFQRDIAFTCMAERYLIDRLGISE